MGNNQAEPSWENVLTVMTSNNTLNNIVEKLREFSERQYGISSAWVFYSGVWDDTSTIFHPVKLKSNIYLLPGIDLACEQG